MRHEERKSSTFFAVVNLDPLPSSASKYTDGHHLLKQKEGRLTEQEAVAGAGGGGGWTLKVHKNENFLFRC
jgi:hypothetical protein